MTPQRRAPRPVDAALILAGYLAARMLLAPSGAPLWLAVPLAIVLPLALYPALAGVDGRRLLPWGRAPASSWVWAGVASLALWVVVSASVEPLLRLLESAGFDRRFEMEELESLVQGLREQGIVVLVWVVVVVAAAGEELLFRGAVLSGLRGGMRVPAAVIFTSVLFGAVHGRWVQGSLTVVIGAHLACVVVWTGSLGPAILGHALNNAAALGLLFHAGVDAALPAWTIAAATPLYAISLAMLRRASTS